MLHIPMSMIKCSLNHALTIKAKNLLPFLEQQRMYGIVERIMQGRGYIFVFVFQTNKDMKA